MRSLYNNKRQRHAEEYKPIFKVETIFQISFLDPDDSKIFLVIKSSDKEDFKKQIENRLLEEYYNLCIWKYNFNTVDLDTQYNLLEEEDLHTKYLKVWNMDKPIYKTVAVNVLR